MSSARVSVEYVFNDVINCFKFLDFKKNVKVGLSAVGKMYIVCALMQNAHTNYMVLLPESTLVSIHQL